LNIQSGLLCGNKHSRNSFKAIVMRAVAHRLTVQPTAELFVQG